MNVVTCLDRCRGDLGYHIEDILDKKEKLTRIRLWNHPFTEDEEFDSLISAIAECRHLKQLVLNRCEIRNDHLIKLAPILSTLPNLYDIDFAHNNIGDDEAVYLASILPSRPNLTELDLSHNPLSDRGAIAIANAMQQVQKRAYLDLLCTQITDASVPSLVQLLRTAHQHEVFSLNLTSTLISRAGCLDLINVACQVDKIYISVRNIEHDESAIATYSASIPRFRGRSFVHWVVNDMTTRAVFEAPVRRAYFAFFVGSEGSFVRNGLTRFSAKDGDKAIRWRVLRFLVV